MLNNIHPNIHYKFNVFKKQKLNQNSGGAGGGGEGGGGGGWLFLEPYGQKEAAHVSSTILDLISMII